MVGEEEWLGRKSRLCASRKKLAIAVVSSESISSFNGLRNAVKAAPKVALTVSSASASGPGESTWTRSRGMALKNGEVVDFERSSSVRRASRRSRKAQNAAQPPLQVPQNSWPESREPETGPHTTTVCQ